METIVWIVTGALVGWVAHSYAGLNEDRGKAVSMAIGAVGALIGGKGLAPMFIDAPLDAISVTSFMFAAGVAVALLLVGNLVQNRWNV
jgi:uncharacterized membrane protein YeaQ/YmgE (transglycosylase-associated protein family)